MKIIAIVFFIGSVMQIALSETFSTVTNRELMTMNADRLFEFYVINFVHDVDDKASEVVAICHRYLEEIDTLNENTSEESVKKALADFNDAIQGYIVALNDLSEQCGLAAVTSSARAKIASAIDTKNAEINTLWKGLRDEIQAVLRIDRKDSDFVVQKVQAILRSDKTLQEQVLKKVNEVNAECESLGHLDGFAWNALYNAIGY